MEPSAPPYHSIQHTSDLKFDSVCNYPTHSNLIKQNLFANSDSNKQDSKNNLRNITKKDKKSSVQEDCSTANKISDPPKDSELSSKNKNQPYNKCFKQLSEMKPSTYENVARFHEQQRQIATEIEANKCKYINGSATLHNCCLQKRNNHIDNVGKVADDSCFTNPNFGSDSFPEPKMTGKYIISNHGKRSKFFRFMIDIALSN